MDDDAYTGEPVDRRAALVEEMEITVLDLRSKGYADREIYDALIAAARGIRHGRGLMEFV